MEERQVFSGMKGDGSPVEKACTRLGQPVGRSGQEGESRFHWQLAAFGVFIGKSFVVERNERLSASLLPMPISPGQRS
ncbi:hypothetical protein Q8A67_009236 [Cirrhinus molitorella]|uniref:Uncharacterized protein n=1 Tax=Cirrhinus molitorella TaxID=172907 RepID=A0AA88PYL1_9TELE|nr:hypothetical protein Q8A67_009236 [Cirrhinus molitorella]